MTNKDGKRHAANHDRVRNKKNGRTGNLVGWTHGKSFCLVFTGYKDGAPVFRCWSKNSVELIALGKSLVPVPNGKVGK